MYTFTHMHAQRKQCMWTRRAMHVDMFHSHACPTRADMSFPNICHRMNISHTFTHENLPRETTLWSLWSCVGTVQQQTYSMHGHTYPFLMCHMRYITVRGLSSLIDTEVHICQQWEVRWDECDVGKKVGKQLCDLAALTISGFAHLVLWFLCISKKNVFLNIFSIFFLHLFAVTFTLM